jgi:LysM repeat protein
MPAQPEELLDVASGVVMEGEAEVAPPAQTPQGAEQVEQPPAQAQPGVQPAAATFATYTIQKGDTLFGIARAHGMSVTELQAVNALTTIVIRAGDTLKVRGTVSPAPSAPAPAESGTETSAVQPAAPTPAPAPAELTPQPAQPATARYLVQRGETYYSISRALGCPVGELMGLNSTQDLKYGTYIVVPASATNKVPPATQPQ